MQTVTQVRIYGYPRVRFEASLLLLWLLSSTSSPMTLKKNYSEHRLTACRPNTKSPENQRRRLKRTPPIQHPVPSLSRMKVSKYRLPNVKPSANKVLELGMIPGCGENGWGAATAPGRPGPDDGRKPMQKNREERPLTRGLANFSGRVADRRLLPCLGPDCARLRRRPL